MKKSLLACVAALAVCFNVEAQAADPQTFGVATEGQSFQLEFNYSAALLPIKLLNNGQPFTSFAISSISTVSPGVYRLTITPQARGIYNLTAIAIDPVLGDSLPSNICTVTNRHAAPGQLKKI